MSDNIIKIKNAYVEIEIHGPDLIIKNDDDGGTKVLHQGIKQILEYLQDKFQMRDKIN